MFSARTSTSGSCPPPPDARGPRPLREEDRLQLQKQISATSKTLLLLVFVLRQNYNFLLQ
jgi:hypothetical protein